MVAMSQQSGTQEVVSDYSENGRGYCGYRRGRYLLPIDDAEQDRLDIFHKLIVLARNEKLFEVPPPKGAHVLDIGTGTGIWAIDVADQLYARSEDASDLVEGWDLAMIQPSAIPATVKFTRTDVESPWPALEQTLDMIHIQMMLGCIRDWPELYRKSFRHLKPGGYIEQVEIEWVPRSDDGTLAQDSPLIHWSSTLSHAMRTYGLPIDVFDAGAELRAAGFTNITENMVKLPVSPWSPNEAEALIGRWFNLGLTHGLEAMTLAPFTRVEGWSKAHVDELVEALKRDICRLSVHAYCRMFVWTARKPGQ
ncbi:regulator of secondary metabolism (methyltransferase domain-containing protein) [Colletotrichum truncatum]|uniref:Regulator of secondary metabolism (Methyltransferase domain-containing protein) n=1 Tax=Colletotrichum truncatum TaxID=5467 RepID=A0ACC3YW48_COLTU|nr:regulator of secondary metabolism (methyltransferase domain-containing protein) [Colletotrichum truncatum]KAF6798546.1 regulator of secondary metabolism (methyltransferase domain-containing protein) [Colletotrichum truncatum]